MVWRYRMCFLFLSSSLLQAQVLHRSAPPRERRSTTCLVVARAINSLARETSSRTSRFQHCGSNCDILDRARRAKVVIPYHRENLVLFDRYCGKMLVATAIVLCFWIRLIHCGKFLVREYADVWRNTISCSKNAKTTCVSSIQYPKVPQIHKSISTPCTVYPTKYSTRCRTHTISHHKFVTKARKGPKRWHFLYFFVSFVLPSEVAVFSCSGTAGVFSPTTWQSSKSCDNRYFLPSLMKKKNIQQYENQSHRITNNVDWSRSDLWATPPSTNNKPKLQGYHKGRKQQN